MANEFNTETNNLSLGDLNYLNTIEITLLNDSPQLRKEIDDDPEIDIFDCPQGKLS